MNVQSVKTNFSLKDKSKSVVLFSFPNIIHDPTYINFLVSETIECLFLKIMLLFSLVSFQMVLDFKDVQLLNMPHSRGVKNEFKNIKEIITNVAN